MTPIILSVNLAQMARSPEARDFPGEDMGAILGSVRVVEWHKLTPEQRQARLRQSERKLHAELEFQGLISLTGKEFFARLDSKPSKPKSE